jgi:hypothetical protein
MPTRSRKHSVDRQIISGILKEAVESREAASVRDAFEKKTNPAPVVPETLGGNNGGKTRAASASISRYGRLHLQARHHNVSALRSQLLQCPPKHPHSAAPSSP